MKRTTPRQVTTSAVLHQRDAFRLDQTDEGHLRLEASEFCVIDPSHVVTSNPVKQRYGIIIHSRIARFE